MTANQRRPGFRLPWSSESDVQGAASPAANADDATSAAPAESAPSAPAAESSTEPSADVTAVGAQQAAAHSASGTPAAATGSTAPDAAAPATTPPVAPSPTPSAPGPDIGPGDEFMRELVSAMRGVADEQRKHGLEELRSRAEEHVRRLEADAERRREEIRQRAEADVAAVDEWAKAEAERIKAEAEQRVAARRAQLDQQLAGDVARTETEAKALRARVAEYERELEAFHAQLAEINDPAAFAAAAKRMPLPPSLGATAAAPAPAAPAPAVATAKPQGGESGSAEQAPVEPATGASNGVSAAAAEVHPAEEEVLAARLAELDATLPAGDGSGAAPSEPVTTEIVVKGLGSFGAITGFRQALAGVEGVDGVALSLGQTGEFVFRTTHRAGFDVRQAITKLEGDGAKVEERPEGGYRVTLDRAR